MKQTNLSATNVITKQKNKDSVKTHTKSVHEGKDFSCNQCEYKSKEESELKTHIEQNHDNAEWQISTQEFIEDSRTRRNLPNAEKEKMLNCKDCDWTTGSTTLLNRHIKSCHEGNQESKKYISKRIKCQQCEKKFNKEETYTRHMVSAHKEAQNVTNQELTFPKSTMLLRNIKNRDHNLISNN